MATFNPTSVLPAPGTPVTKQMLFSLFCLLDSITFRIKSVVASNALPAASCRVMSSTEWLRYRALAASMIVGVGEYLLTAHFSMLRL